MRSLVGRVVSATVLLTLASSCVSSHHRAAAPKAAPSGEAATSEKDAWRTSVTPYLWLLGAHGDATIRGTKVKVESKFTDIAGSVDYGAQIHIEMRTDDWGFYIDPSFFALSEDGNLGSIDLDADLDLGIYEVGFVFGLCEWQTEERPPAVLDLLVGIRHWDMGGKFKLSTPGPMGVGSKVTGDRSWTDAVVGARYQRPVSQDAQFHVRADVGGFSFGSSSTFTWSLLTMFSHELEEGERLWYGYRVMGVDYSQGSGPDKWALDARLQGLIFGWQLPF